MVYMLPVPSCLYILYICMSLYIYIYEHAWVYVLSVFVCLWCSAPGCPALVVGVVVVALHVCVWGGV